MRDTAVNKFTLSPSIQSLLYYVFEKSKENMNYRIFLLFV